MDQKEPESKSHLPWCRNYIPRFFLDREAKEAAPEGRARKPRRQPPDDLPKDRTRAQVGRQSGTPPRRQPAPSASSREGGRTKSLTAQPVPPHSFFWLRTEDPQELGYAIHRYRHAAGSSAAPCRRARPRRRQLSAAAKPTGNGGPAEEEMPPSRRCGTRNPIPHSIPATGLQLYLDPRHTVARQHSAPTARTAAVQSPYSSLQGRSRSALGFPAPPRSALRGATPTASAILCLLATGNSGASGKPDRRRFPRIPTAPAPQHRRQDNPPDRSRLAWGTRRTPR